MTQEETAENATPEDARSVARRASTSSSTAATAAGRQVAVLKEDPNLDSAGNRIARSDTLNSFLKLSGYKRSDVLGSSEDRRAFVTVNGGKYIVSKSGKNLRVVSGPAYPKLREQAEEGEEE